MNRDSGGMSTGAAILCTLGIMLFIGWIIGLSEPKCAKSGCSNETKPGSSYCWLHDDSYRSYGGSSYKGGSSESSSGSTSSYSGSTGGSSSGGTNKSLGSTGKKSSTESSSGKEYAMDSYDAGYDAVYDDGDYDYDRYDRDDDYARGVDDALDDWDEFGDDW